MSTVTFITGNQRKVDYLEKYLGYPIEHIKLDLDEIQSLDLREIAEHKARQAYSLIKKPVLVEDASLEFAALGRLPGPFIKFFLSEMTEQMLCDLPGDNSRDATARCVYGYYDGKALKLFEGSMAGKVAERPAGNGGMGWDRVFIPEGYKVTRAELREVDDKKTYLIIKPLAAVKKFLESIPKSKD